MKCSEDGARGRSPGKEAAPSYWNELVGFGEGLLTKEECATAAEMAFARKASGLVRGLSFIDAFGVGTKKAWYKDVAVWA